MRTTSSGLVLLLAGVVLLSAFLNGALPRLLDMLFTPAAAGTAATSSAVVPAAKKNPQGTIGAATGTA